MKANDAGKLWGKPQTPAYQFSWQRLALVLFLALWALISLWLLSYYLESIGLIGAGAGTNANGHMRMDFSQAKSLGFGMMSATNGETNDYLTALLILRQTAKNGTYADVAVQTENIRAKLTTGDNEAYRMTWAPVLACANSGCDNRIYIQAAGELAASDPRLASHAMVIEASYWYDAKSAGDETGSAKAVAKLDTLVKAYGNADVTARYQSLNECGQNCPIFEELLIDFMASASKI